MSSTNFFLLSSLTFIFMRGGPVFKWKKKFFFPTKLTKKCEFFAHRSPFTFETTFLFLYYKPSSVGSKKVMSEEKQQMLWSTEHRKVVSFIMKIT
jgi:hypothetical protein